MAVGLAGWLPVCLSVCLSVCLPACLSVCLPSIHTCLASLMVLLCVCVHMISNRGEGVGLERIGTPPFLATSLADMQSWAACLLQDCSDV